MCHQFCYAQTESKSLYFKENTEIQAFLLHTESSLNSIFAVACEEKAVKIHTEKGDIMLWSFMIG